jgi:rRNA maturation protein Nop10
VVGQVERNERDLSVDLARWFKPDELETCPRCGEQRLVPSEPGSTVRICLDCGGLTVEPTS